MLRTVLCVSLLAFATTANAQSLDMTGDCPGAVDISASGLTPGGAAVFLLGAVGEGSDVIGVGSCAGTATGLAGMRFGARVIADGAGNAAFSPSIPDGRCDTPVQVLDVSSCGMSNVTSANAGGGGLDIIDTYEGGPQMIYRLGFVDLPDGDASFWYQEQCEAVGLRPVSCDPAVYGGIGGGYDASAYNAVPLDAGHFLCNVSTFIMSYTGWDNIITFHVPSSDLQGVCERGCTLSGLPITPICTD
ncbi:MAG: hypothetical protein ACI8PZ_002129 [Myxococcota bacterium]|jgi:hypothetical protein